MLCCSAFFGVIILKPAAMARFCFSSVSLAQLTANTPSAITARNFNVVSVGLISLVLSRFSVGFVLSLTEERIVRGPFGFASWFAARRCAMREGGWCIWDQPCPPGVEIAGAAGRAARELVANGVPRSLRGSNVEWFAW